MNGVGQTGHEATVEMVGIDISALTPKPGAPTGLSLHCQGWHLFARGPSLPWFCPYTRARRPPALSLRAAGAREQAQGCKQPSVRRLLAPPSRAYTPDSIPARVSGSPPSLPGSHPYLPAHSHPHPPTSLSLFSLCIWPKLVSLFSRSSPASVKLSSLMLQTCGFPRAGSRYTWWQRKTTKTLSRPLTLTSF